MPWFIKSLNETTAKDIELKVCENQGGNDKDAPLDITEVYIYIYIFVKNCVST